VVFMVPPGHRRWWSPQVPVTRVLAFHPGALDLR
jgi:hypothetical protein